MKEGRLTDTEDDKLIERLARAACEADGLTEEELHEQAPDGLTPLDVYGDSARRHLAMQRELERARGDMEQDYDPFTLHDRDLADFGHARARDIAFDAVHKLWERRRSEGITQADLAEKIGRDPAWVSRILDAPGNWTLRTLGELVVALEGCLEIRVTAQDTDQ